MMKTIAAALLAGTMVLSPGAVRAEDEGPSLEQIAVEAAQTPEQHAALARYYHTRAQNALAEARRHEDMARTYSSGKLTQRQRMKQHCSNLSKQYSQMAGEFEALAKLQKEEATR